MRNGQMRWYSVKMCRHLFRQQFDGRVSTCLFVAYCTREARSETRETLVRAGFEPWVMGIARASKFDFVLGVTGVTNTLFVDRGHTESCMVWKPEPIS
ncbi:uncharacterized protein PgNI_04525 [Pyricularia grisea]|uniref:Uncharacterized protein n=1 Tax=Pyricularia grisea TaxID=148305 RepID=A0A6P8BBR5_PYRGI|nr:uncharacterized protein PgNI_04525 [Pyricularia grisea]TLD13291.1 hypothetical protein PgNI_04525 [Pyricularia grisea]